MSRLVRRLPQILLFSALAVALLIVRNWAYVTTYRLYVSQRVDTAERSTAAQRFDIEGAIVVPQIVMRDDDVIAFKTEVGQPSTLHVALRPIDRARYEIRWRDGDSEGHVLATGEVAAAMTVALPIPPQPGVVEFISHGSLTWIDPRIVRDLRFVPHLAALIILISGFLALSKQRSAPIVARLPADRVVWFRRLAVVGSVTLAVLGVEGGLRALGDRVPGGIATERHNLGEVRRDPRWQDTARYGRRLRARVDAVNEWRDGDVIRMGYIPPAVSEGILHRFAFQTDDEGFRNARTRERIDVAALGDSFTDAMTLTIGDAWPSRLERQMGLIVQNYGTAGFGPQQELRVLKDYAVRHHPRVVVLAYFAGNDLFDAEAFDDFDRSGGAIRRVDQGWRIKDVVSRADTWFLVSALRAAGAWVLKHEEGAEAHANSEPARVPAKPAPAAPEFDRGMFAATVNGHVLRWAFMPPYLNTLNFSQGELAARRGWALTRRAIVEMSDVSRDAGAELVVVFLPFKSQVYLPWLVQALAPPALGRALQFYLPDNPGVPDVAAMMRNRLAQNVLMRSFCVEHGIPFLDTTDALQGRFLAGENVYFPDESHLNELGHAVVAEVLARYLVARISIQSR